MWRGGGVRERDSAPRPPGRRSIVARSCAARAAPARPRIVQQVGAGTGSALSSRAYRIGRLSPRARGERCSFTTWRRSRARPRRLPGPGRPPRRAASRRACRGVSAIGARPSARMVSSSSPCSKKARESFRRCTRAVSVRTQSSNADRAVGRGAAEMEAGAGRGEGGEPRSALACHPLDALLGRGLPLAAPRERVLASAPRGSRISRSPASPRPRLLAGCRCGQRDRAPRMR